MLLYVQIAHFHSKLGTPKRSVCLLVAPYCFTFHPQYGAVPHHTTRRQACPTEEPHQCQGGVWRLPGRTDTLWPRWHHHVSVMVIVWCVSTYHIENNNSISQTNSSVHSSATMFTRLREIRLLKKSLNKNSLTPLWSYTFLYQFSLIQWMGPFLLRCCDADAS